MLEWLVELRGKYEFVRFFGQDDKAKIPVGYKVAVSTGVRSSTTGIVDASQVVNGNNPLRSMDHDFLYANLTPSVTLRGKIPPEIGGSFFTVKYLQLYVILFSIHRRFLIIQHNCEFVPMPMHYLLLFFTYLL